MNELNVQTFLNKRTAYHRLNGVSGQIVNYDAQHRALDDLKTHYAIKHNISECGQLVSLKYDQLDSPKTNKIVRECRGLVLEVSTWGAVCQQFHRFFNFGEETDVTNEDIPNMKIVEKHDGSLMSLYFYDGKWRCCTSGTPTASSNVGDWGITFSALFWEAIGSRYKSLDKQCTYTFELTAPQNKVVRDYSTPDVVLLTVRHELFEQSLAFCDNVAEVHGFTRPVVYDLGDIDGILDSWKDLAPQEEGYVAVDYSKRDAFGNFLRCKIKNPAYVALHRLKDSSCNSRRALLQVVLTGEKDEILTYFPEYVDIIEDFDEKVTSLIKEHNAFAEQALAEAWPPQQIGPRAGQAGLIAGWIFTIVKGKAANAEEVIRTGIKDKGIKCFAKTLMKRWYK